MKPQFNKSKLMLIDDNKHLAITLGDFLTVEGFDVTKAKSGEEALKKLESVTPDIIILDINMPGIGGVGFLNALQKREIKLECPVLVFTARSAMEEFFETLDIAGFIAKPCAEMDLLHKINEVLATNKGINTTSLTDKPNHKILVGENDPLISKQLKFDLTQNGFDFKIVESGGELIEAATTFMPNLIVLKDILPGMNGRVVASLLRAMPSTKNIPTILYDETRTIEDESRYGSRIPEGVTQYLTTGDSVTIMNAIKTHIK